MRVLRTAPLAAAGALVLGLATLTACGGQGRAHATPAPAASYSVPLVSPTPQGTLAGRSVPAHTTRPFSMIGVVWNDARARLNTVVRIRTRDRSDGRWTPWQTLRSDDQEDPGTSTDKEPARGYTSPLWVGPSNGVQVVFGPPSGALPAGLRLALVDPGGPAALPAVPGGPPSWLLLHPPVVRPLRPHRFTVPRPAMVGRAGWRADESLRHRVPIYAPMVRMVFIHHTDNPNNYSCSEVPELIRAMYQYHVTELAWDDIGYNFLVDRCGTIYEGRAGGVDRPVVGGHTMGFNIGSMGIAAIGDFRAGHQVPQPMIDAIARLAAWKLSVAGVSPLGKATMISQDSATRYRKGTSVVLNTISGHRDAVYTECPGDSLYAALPAIRAEAARLVAAAAAHRPH